MPSTTNNYGWPIPIPSDMFIDGPQAIRDLAIEVDFALADDLDTGWIIPTYLNGWTTYSTAYAEARYRRIRDRVFIQGLVKGGSSGLAVFNLPVGFRPTTGTRIFGIIASNNVTESLAIRSDGDVVPASTVSNVWCSLCCSFGLD